LASHAPLPSSPTSLLFNHFDPDRRLPFTPKTHAAHRSPTRLASTLANLDVVKEAGIFMGDGPSVIGTAMSSGVDAAHIKAAFHRSITLPLVNSSGEIH